MASPGEQLSSGQGPCTQPHATGTEGTVARRMVTINGGIGGPPGSLEDSLASLGSRVSQLEKIVVDMKDFVVAVPDKIVDLFKERNMSISELPTSSADTDRYQASPYSSPGQEMYSGPENLRVVPEVLNSEKIQGKHYRLKADDVMR